MNERLPRRAFLGYASLSASAFWMPRRLGTDPEASTGQDPAAGADEEIPPLDVVLKQALERARGVGKPLLVFVVPVDRKMLWKRQSAFGQYLNLCADEALADLALCEVACARMADLHEVIPGTEGIGEPLFVLIDNVSAPPMVRGLDAMLEETTTSLSYSASRERREREREEFERQVTARVDCLAALVGGAIVGEPGIIERRALHARNALGELGQQIVERVLDNPAGSAADVDCVAAIVRHIAENDRDQRGTWMAALARAARSRLRLTPPAGAWWAVSTGCGHRVEGRTENKNRRIGCGMSRTPELSRRFLHFYTTCSDVSYRSR